MTCNRTSELAAWADVLIAPETGAEALTGSTRLKAGTGTTKVLVNAFSTALMIRLGRTYSNLMVDLVSTTKLDRRAVALLNMAAGSSDAQSLDALRSSNGETPVALLMLLTGSTPADCRAALRTTGGIRAALSELM